MIFMKRVLLGITALLLVCAPAYAALEGRSAMFKLGVAGGQMDTDTSAGDEDLDIYPTVGLEYLFRFESGIDLGLGAAFEKHELKDVVFQNGFNDVESYPVYGILRYRFNVWENWTPYIYGNLGYAFTDKDRGDLTIDSGPYYGAGVGLEYRESFGIEAGWSRTEFDAEIDGKDIDPVSDLFKLSLTMRLDH